MAMAIFIIISLNEWAGGVGITKDSALGSRGGGMVEGVGTLKPINTRHWHNYKPIRFIKWESNAVRKPHGEFNEGLINMLLVYLDEFQSS